MAVMCITKMEMKAAVKEARRQQKDNSPTKHAYGNECVHDAMMNPASYFYIILNSMCLTDDNTPQQMYRCYLLYYQIV